MEKTVDFYFTTISPWTYLGMGRFRRLVADTQAQAHYKPMDLTRVLATIEIKPLFQRPQPLQRNRLQELKRWRAYLGIPIHLHPRHFPTDANLSCRMIAAAAARGEDVGQLTESFLAACWVHELDIADETTAIRIADEAGFDGNELLQTGQQPAAAALVQANTDEAIARGVIGSPCYVMGEEVFFGQDRLDFVERALKGSDP